MAEETDWDKIAFLSLFNLQPTNHNILSDNPTSPEKDSSTTLQQSKPVAQDQSINLAERNRNVKTGYENFCIKKGDLKLFPVKDFDFVGKKIVCQKCFQIFASRLSYKMRVNTNVCVRTWSGKNPDYLKYKNKHSKKRGRKIITNLAVENIKQDILSNPEKLSVLETRNRRYSHNTVQRSNPVKRKRVCSTNTNDEPVAKRPKARPNKETDVEPKRRRGRPKKAIAETVGVDSLNRDGRSLSNVTETNEDELKKCRR